MAYKRYLYRNGKKFGPYYYESYRDETGKVRKRYVGTKDPNKKLVTPTKFSGKTKPNFNMNKRVVMIISLIFIFGLIFFFLIGLNITKINTYKSELLDSVSKSDHINFYKNSNVSVGAGITGKIINENISGSGTSSAGSGTSSSNGGEGTASETNTIKLAKVITVETYPFSLNKDFLRIILKQGETKKEFIKLTNTQVDSYLIETKVSGIENLVNFSESIFTIKPAESKIIEADFKAKDNAVLDVYIGKISFLSGSMAETIYTIIIIEPKTPKFDLNVNIVNKNLLRGDKLNARIDISNLEGLENISADLVYGITDVEGKIVSSRKESVSVKDKIELYRELELPFDLQIGDYIFYSRLNYENLSLVSTDNFVLNEKEELPTISELQFYIGLLVFFFLFIIITILIAILRRKKSHPPKIDVYSLRKRKLF